MSDLELLTIGRICTDLYAEQLGVPLADVRTFRKSVGGTATNVAVAAARLGHRAAVLTKVGDDPFGHYVKGALEHTFGVDTRYVGMHATLRTPLAFAELQDPGEPTIVFYREPMAPEMTITPDDVDLEVVAAVPVLWVPVGALAAEPSRGTVNALLGHRGRRTHTVLDLDWRPALWGGDEDRAHEAVAEVLPLVTMAIGNRDECRVAVGTSDPHDAADRLLALGLQAAIVKMGGDGVLVATADGTRTPVPPQRVEVVCGLGAGDAFGGAICHGLLLGWDLARCAVAGNAAGAIVAGRLMCADDMPTNDEIEEMMRRGAH
ncbi:MAG: 5-dehydro-2-deoxygluconokinase [Actinomycetota bacterium]|jgi:5-dehydro-2-deoxygluconokinase